MRPPRRPAPAGGRQRALRIRGRLMHIKTKMKLRDRSLASPRNFFTPGARPATASAAAPRAIDLTTACCPHSVPLDGAH